VDLGLWGVGGEGEGLAAAGAGVEVGGWRGVREELFADGVAYAAVLRGLGCGGDGGDGVGTYGAGYDDYFALSHCGIVCGMSGCFR